MIDNTYGANTACLWSAKIGCLVFAHPKCDVRAYVRCRRARRGRKGSWPQMTCGWHSLCQTGRQVALGSHSRTWVFEPCCTSPHGHTNTGTRTPKAGWVTGTMHLGAWLPVCCKLEMAWLTEETRENKKKIFQPPFRVFVTCILNNKRTWIQTTAPDLSEMYAHMFARLHCSNTISFSLPVDHSQVICMGV